MADYHEVEWDGPGKTGLCWCGPGNAFLTAPGNKGLSLEKVFLGGAADGGGWEGGGWGGRI